MTGRRLSLVTILCMCSFHVSVIIAANSYVVKISEGLIEGKEITSISTKNRFIGFLGIPYAKPPVGILKFKDPEAPESWSGTRKCKEEGSPCTQKNDLTKTFIGVEDCLFLNVYTQKLPGDTSDILRPVMFFIHGGGFYFGSSSKVIYGADYLVDNDVVLVTFNYRLGPQGFLSLENKEVPGNAGLKDQVMALRWVQKNIIQFGGDPNKVTIFGQSAGATSVQYHMLSSMSKGLFHRAIMQSGSVLNPWAFTNSSKNIAFRLGKKLGFETDDPKELVEFLRNVKSMDLTKASHDLLLPEENPMTVNYPFLPTIDTESEDVFLVASPRELLESGKFNYVPLIVGVTSNEGIFAVNYFNDHPEALKILDKEFERVIPQNMGVTPNTTKAQEVSNAIRKYYFGDQHLDKETKLQLINLLTDEWFIKDINAAAEKIAARTNVPLYFYQFSYNGEFGFIKKLLNAEKLPGACHADDIGYLFQTLFTANIHLKPDNPTKVTQTRMTSMWTNFAKTGNPIPEEDPLLNVTWTPYTTDNQWYLNIDKELSMQKDLNKERLTFWKDLYNSVGSKI